MNKFRKPASRSQLSLLPQSVDEFVGSEDLVRYIDALVDELNLSKVKRTYSYQGRPGYDPVVLTKILVYGKIRGIRSSRALATACRENLKFMFIASNETPDFRTISDFRKRFCKELAGILQQTIQIGVAERIITLEHVAVDGSLIKGFAGDSSYKKPEYIAEQIKQLETLLLEDIESDDEGENDQDGGSLPPELQDKKKLKKRLQDALAKHKRLTGKPEKVSTTDPECKYTRKGPCYNGQAAVDEESLMIVGGFATNTPNDSGLLPPLLKDIEKNTGKNPKNISADAGYNAKVGLADMKQREIKGFIPQRARTSKGYAPDKFKYDEKSDSYICPSGQRLEFKHRKVSSRVYRASDCSGCNLRSQCLRNENSETARTLTVSKYNQLESEMIQRVNSPLGRQMAHKRSSTIELAFAHIKYIRKLRRFIFRGLNMIDAMWKFELGVYNIERLVRLRMKKALIT
ncbi:MAG: IS1182 family transposase [Bdellovibrionota bacterium]